MLRYPRGPSVHRFTKAERRAEQGITLFSSFFPTRYSGATSSVRDSQNPNSSCPFDIGNVIRKHPQIHSPIALLSTPRNGRILLNPTDHKASFLLQTQAESD